MEYIGLLQQKLVSELAKEINKNATEKINDTPEEVFSNLDLIYEERKEMEFGTETGKSYKYMPKQYKAMVMRLVAPDYCPSVRVSSNDYGITAEAYLFLHHDDTKPVAQGKQFLPYTAAPEELETDVEKRAYIEATVRGMALSKAYQEFGIGSWYNYQFEPEENPDDAMSKVSSQNELNPTIGYDRENGAQEETATSTTNKVEKEEEPTVQLPALQTEQTEENESVENSEAASETESVSVTTENTESPAQADATDAGTLDWALNRVAPCGKAQNLGLTLGATAKKYPQNLCWMYKQQLTDEDKLAIETIAKSDPEIMEQFRQNGIGF